MRQMPRKPSASRLLLILKPLQHAGVFIQQFEELSIGQADHGVGIGFELLQTCLGLELAAVALKVERQRHQGQHKRAALPRHAGEDRRRAGASAAAQAG
jgi:hypothetical protein